MHSISKKYTRLQEESVYIQKFLSREGQEFGLRLATPDDAKSLSSIFKEIYGYQYIKPYVYNIELFKKELSRKNSFWFIGELLENSEIGGAGLIAKNRYIAHAGSLVVKKKFQGIGMAAKMGTAGIIFATRMPQFKDVLRLDGEARTIKIGAQKTIQDAGGIPYGLIPAFINLGDKRKYKTENNKPPPPVNEEAAFLYSLIFKSLWKQREKEIHLLDNEDFIFFYNYIKNIARKRMNNDVLILDRGKKRKSFELYGVSKDFYEGILNLYGYIKEKSLNNLLKTYNAWRIILWRIPTTQNGIHSMSLALEKGFNILGYDIGFSNLNWTLYDSVIMAYYPNGGSQVLKVDCLDLNRPLYNKVREIFFSRMN
ncbi:MAG: hypothetical protein ACFFBF_13550 [Promethearchaeota archaeon]